MGGVSWCGERGRGWGWGGVLAGVGGEGEDDAVHLAGGDGHGKAFAVRGGAGEVNDAGGDVAGVGQ